MKLLLIFLFFTFSAFADVYLSPGESVLINNQRVYCARGPENNTRYSQVDQTCLRLKKQNYHYTPRLEDLLQWAGECRSQVSTPPCQKIGESQDSGCSQLLMSWYPYSGDNRALSQIEKACKLVSYHCP